MEPSRLIALTPEQIAAMTAGGGLAECEDPNTHVHHRLIKLVPKAVDDDYIREMLAEAAASVARGEYADWDAEEIKRECRERFEKRQSNN